MALLDYMRLVQHEKGAESLLAVVAGFIPAFTSCYTIPEEYGIGGVIGLYMFKLHYVVPAEAVIYL